MSSPPSAAPEPTTQPTAAPTDLGASPTDPGTSPLAAPTTADRSAKLPRGWLIAAAALTLALVISAVVLFSVMRPPSYEPVPIPSISST